MKYILPFLWITMLAGYLIVMLSGCATERYDSEGNGTWPIDKVERASVHTFTGEHW